MLRHIVLFKFNDDLDATSVQVICDTFAGLPEQIEEIAGFEMGTNISPENLHQGYTHCFVVTFQNTDDRDAYLPHAAHQKFVSLLDGKVDKVLVFDFESSNDPSSTC